MGTENEMVERKVDSDLKKIQRCYRGEGKGNGAFHSIPQKKKKLRQ